MEQADAPQVEVRPSPIHGLGVFAKRPFAAGERILTVDLSRVVTPDAPLDPARGEFEHHCEWMGDTVVLLRSPERHINHS